MSAIRICIQTAIAVLHDLSSDNVLQSVKFSLPEEEWKDLLDKLEIGVLNQRHARRWQILKYPNGKPAKHIYQS